MPILPFIATGYGVEKREQYDTAALNVSSMRYILSIERFIRDFCFGKLDSNDVDEDMMMQVFKRVRRLANKKVQNGRGKAWISQQLQMKKRA